MVKDDKRNALNMEIQINFREGATFDYGDEKDCPLYDTHIRRWRHLNFFQYRCFITARVPRVKTQNGVKTIDVPWEKAECGFILI